jgi:hypothetical protein
VANNKNLLKGKIERMRAAVSLEPHERVPIAAMANFWPVGYSNRYTMQEAYYNVDVLGECYREVLSKFNGWDAFNISMVSLGPMLDATGSKRYSVPGRDLSPHAEFQHPDLSLMSADEYKKLIKDPVRFQIEEILPRLCKRIASDDPSVHTKSLAKAALYFGASMEKAKSYSRLWQEEYGIPPLFQKTSIYVPIDWISNKLRGFYQTLIDIKERPEEVQEACEALVPFILDVVLSTTPRGDDYPLLFNPHTLSPFISPKDYETLFWPTFKKIIDKVVEGGYKVWVFFENNQEQHLERIQDLPKAKIVAHMESTDLAKAKKALGGKICIAGGMPPTLLARGTPEEVKERTLAVLRLFEDEPGFIMSCETPIPVNAIPDNVQVWLDTMRKCGHMEARTKPKEVKDQPEVQPGGKNSARNCRRSAITAWEEVKAEFGKIEGDEAVIKEKWEEQEKLFLSFLVWLIR